MATDSRNRDEWALRERAIEELYQRENLPWEVGEELYFKDHLEFHSFETLVSDYIDSKDGVNDLWASCRPLLFDIVRPEYFHGGFKEITARVNDWPMSTILESEIILDTKGKIVDNDGLRHSVIVAEAAVGFSISATIASSLGQIDGATMRTSVVYLPGRLNRDRSSRLGYRRLSAMDPEFGIDRYVSEPSFDEMDVPKTLKAASSSMHAVEPVVIKPKRTYLPR